MPPGDACRRRDQGAGDACAAQYDEDQAGDAVHTRAAEAEKREESKQLYINYKTYISELHPVMRIGASCARLRARLGSSMEYDATLVPVTTQEHQSPRDIHHNRQREDSRPSCIGVVVACVHRGGGGVNTTRSYDELSGAACRREPVPSKPFWQAASQPGSQPGGHGP
jgi:hypothetical protein